MAAHLRAKMRFHSADNYCFPMFFKRTFILSTYFKSCLEKAPMVRYIWAAKGKVKRKMKITVMNHSRLNLAMINFKMISVIH